MFAEEELDRDEHMSQLKQCLVSVIVDEVSCDGLQPIVLMFALIILQIKQLCPLLRPVLKVSTLEQDDPV